MGIAAPFQNSSTRRNCQPIRNLKKYQIDSKKGQVASEKATCILNERFSAIVQKRKKKMMSTYISAYADD
jgi:hypothetical protein